MQSDSPHSLGSELSMQQQEAPGRLVCHLEALRVAEWGGPNSSGAPWQTPPCEHPTTVQQHPKCGSWVA